MRNLTRINYMGKMLFITLIGISLILASCLQQTLDQNQNLNQPVVNQPTINQSPNVNQPSASTNQNTNQSNINQSLVDIKQNNPPAANANRNTNQNTIKPECVIKECPEGYTQYYIPDCGLSPNGPVPCPSEIKQQEDCLCHKICGRNGDRDCPTEMPKCKSVIISDTIQDLCFEK